MQADAGHEARRPVGGPEPVVLAEAGRARSAIVTGPAADDFHCWVAGELQRYIRLLSGAEVPIVRDSSAPATPARTRILIGGPEINPAAGAVMPSLAGDLRVLKEDGFVLKTLRTRGQDTLVAAGRGDAGDLYAVYDLLERLGIVFQMTRDIIPDRKPDLAIAPLDVRREPALSRRGHHLRHFVTPWMSADYLCRYIDQLAKMKCNYIEFYWYEGGPWVEYSHRGEKRLLGSLYTPESGFTSWLSGTYRFSGRDVVVGRDHFPDEWLFAPEFQGCSTPEQAHAAARDFLCKVIDHAHRRRIRIWLGAGDCPFVPPNLARRSTRGPTLFGIAIPPGDPAGAHIWTEILCSMVDTYPEADGYWLWLAEMYLAETDAATRAAVEPLDRYGPLVPDAASLAAMGYDNYVAGKTEEELKADALVQLHYAGTVTEAVRGRFPGARLGVSLLGRSYLFPALHAMLPQDIALQSMESAICWNRGGRVPMENFASCTGRDMFLVPRLDDDENELAAQFNVRLYEHFGFCVQQRVAYDGSAPPTWTMIRHPSQG